MTKKRANASLMLIVFLVSVSFGSAPQTGRSTPITPTMSIAPPSVVDPAKTSGTDFSVDLLIADADFNEGTDVFAWQVALVWDPTVVDIDDNVTWGDFMDQPRIGYWGDLTSDAAAGQRIVNVADGTKFQAGFTVLIKDDANNETNEIASISGTELTVRNDLAHTYTTEANAGCYPMPDLTPATNIQHDIGRLLAAQTTTGPAPGVSGSGWLCTLTFHVLTDAGETDLDVNDPTLGQFTYVINGLGEAIGDDEGELNKESGYFSNILGPEYMLTIMVDGMGSTDPAPGDHIYSEGAIAEVDAIPDADYTLDHWELDGADVGAAYPYTVTMNANHTLVAFFLEMPTTVLHVDPATVSASAGEAFTINISVQDVANLYSYETKVGYDNAVLQPIAVEEGPFIHDQTTAPPPGTYFTFQIQDDFVYIACVTLGQYPGVSGNGILFNITFNVIDWGESPLDLYDSMLLDSTATEIAHGTLDGFFSTPPPLPDFQIGAIPDQLIIKQGNADLSVVTVVSLHGFEGVVDLMVSEVPPEVSAVLDPTSLTLPPDGSVISNLTVWVDVTATPATYTLTITGTSGMLEHSSDISLTIEPAPVHDVAVTGLSAYPTTVTVGESVELRVTVENEGSEPEEFGLLLSYDDTLISSSGMYLPPRESRTYWIYWSTHAVEPGTYTVRAVATAVPGEIDIEDNTFIDGTVTVQPRPIPRLLITPDSGPVGTTVTVNGSAFPRTTSLYLMFDDNFISFLVLTDEEGNFTASFNVPLAEPGEHTIRAWTLYYYPYEYASAEATFTVIDTTPLDLEVDAGAIYFKNEIAEFFVQISFKGQSLDVTSLSATLYKPEGPEELLAAHRIGVGLYKLEYALHGKGTMLGTYTLIVNADFSNATVNTTGTALRAFIVKSPWREGEHDARNVALSVATIAAALGLIVVWRRENRKLKI